MDPEVEAIEEAYAKLSKLDRAAQQRALCYLDERLAAEYARREPSSAKTALGSTVVQGPEPSIL